MHQEHSGGTGIVAEYTSAIGGMIWFSEKVDGVVNKACLHHNDALLALYCNHIPGCCGLHAAVMMTNGEFSLAFSSLQPAPLPLDSEHGSSTMTPCLTICMPP